jgi:hypothetical protein
MPTPTKSEPRAHHFVPQCWLSGFTESGQKNGRLWVTDLKRQKQWPSSPINAGHRRDFYRLSASDVDPIVVEKAYSRLEDGIGPILRALDEDKRYPTDAELEALLTFIAIQWTRVPAFRPTVLAIADSIHRSFFAGALKSPEAWAKSLQDAGIPLDSPGADYEKMREFQRSRQYSLSAETDWYVMRAFKAAETIVPSLIDRQWGLSLSRTGSFIASDNPVALDGPSGQKIGFKNAEIVLFPISRHVFLHGTKVRVRQPRVSFNYIARMNTFMMLTADEQVYSHIPNFCWLDESGKYQTDWKLFSKEKIAQSIVCQD